MTNYRSPSFDPRSRAFHRQRFSPSYSLLYYQSRPTVPYGWSGADYGLWSKGVLEAIDYKTGKIRWSHDLGGRAGSGVLTTASGLTFSGDASGNFLRWIRQPARRFAHAGAGGQIFFHAHHLRTGWTSGCIDERRRSDLRMGTSSGSSICSSSTLVCESRKQAI